MHILRYGAAVTVLRLWCRLRISWLTYLLTYLLFTRMCVHTAAVWVEVWRARTTRRHLIWQISHLPYHSQQLQQPRRWCWVTIVQPRLLAV